MVLSNAAKSTTKSTSVSPEQAAANAQAIRELWARGKDSLDRVNDLKESKPRAFNYGNREALYAKEAKLFGGSIDGAAKARRIAIDFSEDDIERICKHVVKHRAPFSASMLVVSLRVPVGPQRNAMIQRAIKERWTTLILTRAIHALALHVEKRQYAGRKPRIPANASEALTALGGVAVKFFRLAGNSDVRALLPHAILALVDDAIAKTTQVNNAVEKRLQKASKSTAT